MAEVEQVQREVTMELAGQPTMQEIALDSTKVLGRIDAISRVIDGAVKISLQRTSAADWVEMGGKYYLCASGMEKIRSIWGCYFRGRIMQREEYPDGSYAYICLGEVGSKVLDGLYGETTLEIEGMRSSKDPFFSKGNRDVDPTDVRKAAYANFTVRAIGSLLGLKNLTADDLAHHGINVGKIGKVTYQSGAEGGGNSLVISDGQRKRLFAISREAQVSDETIKALLSCYGWTSTNSITRDKYEEIVTTVQGGSLSVSKRIVNLKSQKPVEREAGEDNG